MGNKNTICQGAHCKCMNLDCSYPFHYRDCVVHNPNAIKSHTPTVDSSVEWEEGYDSSVEKYISSIEWGEVKDPCLTLIIGNMRGLATHIKKELGDLPRTNRQSLITRIKGEVEKSKVQVQDDKAKAWDIGYNAALTDLLNRIDKIV